MNVLSEMVGGSGFGITHYLMLAHIISLLFISSFLHVFISRFSLVGSVSCSCLCFVYDVDRRSSPWETSRFACRGD